MPRSKQPTSGGPLWDLVQSRIPVNDRIIELTIMKFESSGESLEELAIASPSQFVEKFRDTAYEVFKEYQLPSIQEGIVDYSKLKLSFPANEAEVQTFLREIAADLNSMFLSLSQSRKSRAGSILEYVVRQMFVVAGIPFERAKLLNGKPDFILPSKAHYEKNPTDCLIVTVKQTLRERWRQVTTEGHRARKVFLITLDKNVKPNDLAEMNVSGVVLVVPEELKLKQYEDTNNVISLEFFLEHHVRPALKRWRTSR